VRSGWIKLEAPLVIVTSAKLARDYDTERLSVVYSLDLGVQKAQCRGSLDCRSDWLLERPMLYCIAIHVRVRHEESCYISGLILKSTNDQYYERVGCIEGYMYQPGTMRLREGGHVIGTHVTYDWLHASKTTITLV
jgi:hypothetical protein